METLLPRTIDDAIADLLSPAIEGGFQQNPEDMGNYVWMPDGTKKLIGTKYGVTPAALALNWDMPPHKITIKTMEELTELGARNIAKMDYWFKPNFSYFPFFMPLLEACFDMGYNHGPGRAIAMMQTMVGAHADGVIGPITVGETLEFVEECGYAEACDAYAARRANRYHEIVAKYPSQSANLNGWLNRAQHFTPYTPEWWSKWISTSSSDTPGESQ